MNLDDLSQYETIDTQNMIGEIDGLPDQLAEAWRLGLQQDLPEFSGLKYILVSGMGGSAIGGDLVAAYITPSSTLPVIIHRDYDLPAWAQGRETLVIASSHSGNTEETVSAFKRAQVQGCQIMAISTGGMISKMAQREGVPLWHFNHPGQPRAAVGYSFGLLLSLIYRLGLIPDPTKDVKQTVATLLKLQETLRIDIPVPHNPAKRLAGQLMGRWVSILGSDFLAPVARRWKTQINEIAKAWAQFDFLPEADHNTMAGLLNPEKVLRDNIVLFLKGSTCHPRNNLRIDLTRKGFMQEGLNTDQVEAPGETPLEQMWTTLLLGDYVSYYLAVAYGVDPTPVAAIEDLKAAMR